MPRTQVIASGPNFDACHDCTVIGLHGTIGEQQDETEYDQRSDASDDFDKGRIRFPSGKLYGRDGEVKRLTEVYRCLTVEDSEAEDPAPAEESSAVNGSSDLSASTADARVVFLSGLSGTGKSALVEELTRRISSAKGGHAPLVGFGKFEQYCEAAPFSAISESLSMLTRDLLNRDAVELSTVRKSLKKCGLGPADEDCDVLIGLFPFLAPLLRYDSSQQVTENGSAQEDNKTETNVRNNAGGLDLTRLKIVFTNLIVAMTRKQDFPIIMFLDDLQWADEASLEIMKSSLLNKALKHFLFIGSHRTNEVRAEDPYAKLMKEIEDGLGGAVEQIEISGLLPEDIAQFVSDSTEREIEDVQPIVELVYKKTLGNIFFVRQALEELVRRNILYYDIICYEWQWNLDSNQAELDDFVSVDVLDMVKSKMGDLTSECQRSLVMMAYTQNTMAAENIFALMKADGCTYDFAQMLKLLNEAAAEGLLLETQSTNEYSFAHDLIQEAAHSSVQDGEDKDRLRAQIAKVLVDQFSRDGDEWMLFVAAKHLNSVPREYVDSLESLAALNLRVANLAMSKASLAQALELLRSAVTCLEKKTRWDKHYDLTIDLFNHLIETEFLLGNYERAQDAIDEVQENAQSLRDKFTAHLHLVNLAVEKNDRNFELGVQKGLEILQEYGQRIPFSPSKTNVTFEYLMLRRVRGRRPLISLVDMPVMQDDSVMKLLEATLRYEYMRSDSSPGLSKMIMYRALRISFSQGICFELAVLALSCAISMNKNDKPKAANLYSNLAANLQKRFPNALKGGNYVQFQFRLLSCSKVRHPFKEDIGCFPDLHQKALSNGLVDIAMASGLIYANCYFAAGLPLNSLIGSKLLRYEQRSVQMNQEGFSRMFKVSRQFILNLMGKDGGNPTVFKGVAFDEEETLGNLEGNAKKMALRDISSLRLQLAYIFNDETTMGEMLERLKGYPLADLSVARGFLRITWIGLAALLLLKRDGTKTEYLRIGQSVKNRYKKLVNAGGSANALPAYVCVKAAMKPSRASYDEAIKVCSEAGMIHLEAMMCERCAELMKTMGDEEKLEQYMSKAFFLYSDWGAFVKVKKMKEQYDFLSSSKLKRMAPTSHCSSSKDGWDAPAF